jgi:GntR family transcriptional regulator, rspAB operon transcriptional repressor
MAMRGLGADQTERGPVKAAPSRRRLVAEAATPLAPEAQIDRASPIPDQVYRLLRRAIITLRLPPGAAIVEKLITDQLGISRTPVRDAIRLLAEEGLVVIRPQSGTNVARIDRRQVEEGRLIRRALEIEGIRLAAHRIDGGAVEQLRALLVQQERAAAQKRHNDFMHLDDLLHQTISELSGHPRLWRVINASKAQLDRIRHLNTLVPRQEDRTIAQHRAIVEALARKSELRSVKALTHHLDEANQHLDVLLKQHAEMFD